MHHMFGKERSWGEPRVAEQKLECWCLALLLRGKRCREWVSGFGVWEHLSHAVHTGCLEHQSHFSPHSREQGRTAPRKGLCFNFQCEVYVASLVSPSFCMCLCSHSHTCTVLFLGCLCAFTVSYNTGKSFTAPWSILEHGLKLHLEWQVALHSCLGCLIPSFDPPAWPEDMGSSARTLHGLQNVGQGCPQPPVIQHCPRRGDIGPCQCGCPHDISCFIPQ